MIRHLTSQTGLASAGTPQDIVVLKSNIESHTPKAFTLEVYSILLVTDGMLKMRLGGADYCLVPHDVVLVPPGTLCECSHPGTYCSMYSCSFSTAYVKEALVRTSLHSFLTFFTNPSVILLRLDLQQYGTVTRAYEMFRSKTQNSNSQFSRELQQMSFNLLIYEIAEVYTGQRTAGKILYDKNERLVQQFRKVLNLNVRKEHKVSFYADALFVTAGHLTKVVKMVEKRTVKQIIEHALVAEAKILLYNNKLSILDITEELEFSNSSFFCSFFKKHTASTPTQYRQKIQLTT